MQNGPIKVAIRGGTDTPLGGAIIISRILEGGAAARYGRLNVGDQILVCDGVSLIDVTHDEAAQALKRAMDMEAVRNNSYRIAGKFGGLVVYVTTAKLKSAKIFYSHIIIRMVILY